MRILIRMGLVLALPMLGACSSYDLAQRQYYPPGGVRVMRSMDQYGRPYPETSRVVYR